jgi:hypothetical protein
MLVTWGRSALLVTLNACNTSSPTVTPHLFKSDVILEEGDIQVEHGNIFISSGPDASEGPQVVWQGARGSWITGIDVSNNGGSRDFVVAAKNDWPRFGDVQDLIYVAHNDTTAPTVGIGITPPSSSYRLQVSAQDDETGMGSLLVRRTPAQTGHLFAVVDSGGIPRWWLDSDFWLQGASPATAASISIKADQLYHRPLVLGRADGTAVYGFEYPPDQSGALDLRYITAGVTNVTLNTNGVPNFPNGLTASTLRVDSPTAPSSSTSPCTRGDIQFDDDFVYVCITTNTWKRSALLSW